MKKNVLNRLPEQSILGRFGRYGGITLFLICLCANPLLAKVAYSQSIQFNFDLKNVTLERVFDEIRKQSEFEFFYNNDQVNVSEKVNVNVKKASIEQVLDAVLADEYKYKIEDRYILVSKNENVKAIPVQAVQQQDQIVMGIITDAYNDPVTGANIVVKGTSRGTISDFDGKYSIQVNPGETLLFSYLGFQTVERIVNNEKNIDIQMAEDSQALDEVVVVGFGGQRKANLTGAVSSVRMNETLGDRPIINAGDALQGAVPGLLVSGGHEVGKSKTLQIRGAYSVGVKVVKEDGTVTYGADIAPLVLIDNVEGDLNMLNPEDIESISVLKDAASAAIYGARGAGGVIIVKTKAPKSGTRFTMNYNNNLSFESAINLPQQASLNDYFRMYKETGASNSYWAAGQDIDTWVQLLGQYKSNPSSLDIVGDGIYKNPADGKVYYLRERDPFKQLVETSFMQNHNLSFAGSSDKVRYRMSAGLATQNGPMMTDKYKRLNISSFISADLFEWFTQELDIKYASSEKSVPKAQGQSGIFSTRLLSYTPEGIIPGDLYGLDGNYPTDTPLNSLIYGGYPTTIVANPRIFTKSIFKPFDGFEAVFEYTFDKKDTRYDYYTGQYTTTSIQQSTLLAPGKITYTKQHYFTDYNAINLYGTYTKDWKDHNFKLMVGFNQESSHYEMLEAKVEGQSVISVPSLERTSADGKYPTEKYEEVALRGVFARFNYNYQNRYLFEFNGRYDGSSKFPKGERFGFFPSFSAGWNVAEESFMQGWKGWMNALKLRVSWGNLGNQNINPYTYLPTMASGVWAASGDNWLNGGAQVNYIDPPELVRTNFTWETVETIDGGIDITLFKNRLSGSYDWYQRNTKGMLAPGMQLPGVVGASAPYQNTADMRTRGWEASISWNDQIGPVGYRFGFNISDYTSEITKYDDNSAKILKTGDTWNYYPGRVLGEIWGYVVDGFYTIDDFQNTTTWQLKDDVTKIQGNTNTLRPGDYKYKNLSDAGDQTPANTITEGAGTAGDPGDRKIIGNDQPRYLFGATLGVNYKGFDLSAVLQGVGKRDYWLGETAYLPFQAGDMFTTVADYQLNYWSPVDLDNGDYQAANPNALLPRIYNQATANAWSSNKRVNDRLLSNAAYLRIKNVTLSYNFDSVVLRKIQLSGLKLFVGVENLATFSSLPHGYDPETVSWTFPAYRTVSFGLSVTL
ncbi:MAG: TonB-dependent receptor [Tannerella sp.]|jgi:TonB-linked SusC/RagA family outer membrane protein|nr:TonB-dependent receptor [Tannerella sp.]